MTRPDPDKLAEDFLRLNADEFRRFWAMVQFEWNMEDSDIEAMWFEFGKTIRGNDTVIGALASAVYSGRKAALK